jgi:hypothetical protein
MSFWAITTEYKGDGTDRNGGTFVNVGGEPGAFCRPLEAALTNANGLVTEEVLARAEALYRDLEGNESPEDYPSALGVVEWLKANLGKTIASEHGRFFSY